MCESSTLDTSTADLTKTAPVAAHSHFAPARGSTSSVGVSGGASGALERGACLGRYEVLHCLGSGGMGRVFAAHDPELDRSVAIKVLHSDLLRPGARELAQARLRREARATARLAHPNVVGVYDVGVTEDWLFVAMELIEGETLRAWLRREPRSWQQVVEVFGQAGQGLAAAHRQGLVHRDFKPSNVMVSSDGRARVLDFGLARAFGGDRHSKEDGESGAAGPPATGFDPGRVLTRDGKLPGTPAYMAPEQRAGAPLDARTDQYSFCVALYEALYGHLPHEVPDVISTDITGTDITNSSQPPAPPWVRRVLQRGLASTPEDRFDSMEDLLAALDPTSHRQGHRVRRWGVLVLILVLAAVAGVFALREASLWHGGELGAAGAGKQGAAGAGKQGAAGAGKQGAAGAGEQGSAGASLCHDVERKVATVWSPLHRTRVQHAFLATGVPYAASTWEQVEQRFDAYMDDWRQRFDAACEAAHRHSAQSPRVLEHQLHCLDERLHDVGVLTELFGQIEASDLQGAVVAVDSLRELATCSDRRVPSGYPSPPTDEDAQRRLRAARGQLAIARAHHAAGHYSKMLTLTEQAHATARDLDYAPLEAEATFWLAMARGRTGDWGALRQGLLDAAALAQASHQDELQAEALLQLIVTSWLRGDTEDAYEWARLADAAIQRLGHRPDLEARRQRFLCNVEIGQRQYDASLEHCRKSLALDPTMPTWERAVVINNLAIGEEAGGRLDVAEDLYRRAIDLNVQTYGPDHPHIPSSLLNLGQVLERRGQYTEALDYYQRALAELETHLGVDNPILISTLMTLGQYWVNQGEPARAIEYLERAIRLHHEAGAQPAVLAMMQYHLARAFWASPTTHDRDRALSLARHAREVLAESGAGYAEIHGEVVEWLHQRDAS